MRAMVGSPERSLVRLTAGLMLLVGAANVVGYLAGGLFRGEVPPVLAYANLGTAILELSLALGIFRKARAAWAFALAVEGAMAVVNLLGLAPMLRAGAIGQASAALVAVRAVTLVLLILDRKEFR
jgi:hypothetical protein